MYGKNLVGISVVIVHDRYMNKKNNNNLIIGACVIVVLLVIIYYSVNTAKTIPSQNITTATDYKNATYTIDGQSVALVNGISVVAAAPESASSITTQYFGNETSGDLNGDGSDDVAFVLTQNTGGSGTFYYVVAALKTANGYQGTNAILLGDRISPQTTQIQNGEVVVNYADRKASDSMTTAPSVGVTKYLKVVRTTLTEVQASNVTATSSVVYKNTQYGFTFNFPNDWNGYSIVSNTWNGNPLNSATGVQNGPKLLLRNPNWTSANHYEDIPVLVFTLDQWNSYVAGNFAVSAAPIAASELGRNDKYVFALPPRWDFDYSTGYQEADTIIQSNPLHTFNI